MASADLQDELTCSICTDIYTDPVTLTCGHNYCQTCITRTWDNQEKGEYSCPECRHRFRVRPELERNLTLCSIAENFQEREKAGIPCTYCIDYPVLAAKTCLLCEASLCDKHLKIHSKSAEHVLTEPTTSLENRKCSVHKKVLEYYCCKDAACICVSCRLDGEHRGHQVETLNEASEMIKDKLLKALEKLASEKEEIDKAIQILHDPMEDLQEKNRVVKEQAMGVIRHFEEKVKLLEGQILCEVSNQERRINMDKLYREISKIEKVCNLTDDLTVLQYSGVTDLSLDGGNEEGGNSATDELAIQTLNSGLSKIVTELRNSHSILLNVAMAPNISLDENIISEILPKVNNASELPQVGNTASKYQDISKVFKIVSGKGGSMDYPNTLKRF